MTDARTMEIADSLEITGMHYPFSRRRLRGAPGWRSVWVDGRIAGHRFSAQVFPEHAELPDYELGESRISRLWLRRLDDRAVVANFDRGWDVKPADETAQAIVDFLAAGIATHVYGD